MKISRKIFSFLLTHCKTSFLDETGKKKQPLDIVNTDFAYFKGTTNQSKHPTYWVLVNKI